MIYDIEQFRKDGAFKAAPCQEITPEVYEAMRDDPEELPADIAANVFENYRIPVHSGFLSGKPAGSDADGLLFHAFGMNDYGKGKKYYYLGLSHRAPKLDGIYYFMDCMNAFVNGGLFPEKDFRDDKEAVQTAANYEATLYKYEFKDGELKESTILYDPAY